MGTIVGVIIVVALYFLPSIIADRRDRQVGTVVVINLFLGWTFIGWVIALAMACSDSKSTKN